MMRRGVLWSLLGVWCLAAVPVQAEGVRRIPIVFRVAERDEQAVAPASFVAEQLAAANVIYGQLGIEFVDHERLALPGAHAELVTRADRDALARYTKKGVINCFVVAKLMDVDEPGRERRGVHWRPRNQRRNNFLIVSKIGKPYVLAHELGHYFGNQHSDVAGNLMSYAWTVEPPFLDANQAKRVERSLAALLKSGTLQQLLR